MSLNDSAVVPIGGYFEFELPESHALPYEGGLKFQSARAAFLALLRAGNPKRVWMPRYICNAMVAPVVISGVECLWYDVNDRLEVESSVKLAAGDWLLYVNYFGLCGKNVAELCHRFSPDQIVLDYSQSFFSPPEEAVLATIYSPRKFFGVPDGGILYSRLPVLLPAGRDVGSFDRTDHLLRRLGDTPEAGYAVYQQAEETLSECEPKRMSKLSERILASIDFNAVSVKRTENFSHLHDRLGSLNTFPVDISGRAAPLCYPFMTDNPGLRGELIKNKVFVATYWPDAIDRVTPSWAETMVRNLLPLPIDQRCGYADIERMSSIILERIT